MTERSSGDRSAAPLRRIGCMLLMAAALAWPCAGRGADGEAASPAAASAASATAPGENPRPARLSPDIPLRRDDTASGSAVPASSSWTSMLALAALGAALVFWTLRGRRGAAGRRAPPGGGSADAADGWPAPLRAWLSSRGAGPTVRVLGSQRITARHSVHVLQWRGREYLVGCGEQGLTVVDSRPVEPREHTATTTTAAGESAGPAP